MARGPFGASLPLLGARSFFAHLGSRQRLEHFLLPALLHLGGDPDAAHRDRVDEELDDRVDRRARRVAADDLLHGDAQRRVGSDARRQRALHPALHALDRRGLLLLQAHLGRVEHRCGE
jgi:hypothetical protein